MHPLLLCLAYLWSVSCAPTHTQVLAQDAQEDERAWTDLTGAEVEVKREVAEALWADLVGDTAQVLADLEQLLAPPVTTSFRRRML